MFAISHRGRCYALACLLVASLCGRASAETDEEVFARVFKKTAVPAHIPATLVVDNTTRGSITLQTSGDSLLVSARDLLIAVGPSLRREAKKRLVAAARQASTCANRPRSDSRTGRRQAAEVRKVLGKGTGEDLQFLARCDAAIALHALHGSGIDVRYDPTTLELRVTIPMQARNATSHQLNGAPPSAADARRPSAVSGYLNFRASGGHQMSTGSGAAGRLPLRVDVDALLNAHGWLLEGKLAMGEPQIGAPRGFGFDAGDVPISVARGDVRLVHDDPSRALRYIAGDHAVPMGGLQAGYPVAGISVSRNYALQPYRNVQPVGKFDFVLERPAQVTVLVNNAAVQTLLLPAGRHDIRDLRLDGGVNDIELLVRDPSGVERRLLFSTASGEELLAPGIAQFSLDLGFPQASDAGMRTYDFRRPVFAARRRWGVSSALTAGASFDGTLDRQVAGAALAMATTRGNLSIDLAASSASDAPLRLGAVGHAERLRYRYQRSSPGHTVNQFTASLAHYSPDFRSLDLLPESTTEPARYSDDLAVSIFRGLPRGITTSLNLRYQIGRDGPDAQDASITAARAFGPFNVSATCSLRGDGTGPTEKRWFISTHWVLPDARGSVRSTTTRSTASGVTNEIVYSKRSAKPPGGLGTSIGLRQGADVYAATASADYTGYRFTSAATTTSSVVPGTGNVSQTTSGEIATALVFAGGKAAWSRPISGSFVIVAANDTIRGNRIGVNPAFGGYASEDNRLGPAVVSNLEPYRLGLVRVEAPTLPLGYSLGPSSYTVLPSYKSGTLIVVGERGTVFVRGTLMRADGTPIALATGEIKSLDDSTLLPSALMTNRAGRLSTPGLPPGRYEIRIAGESIGARFRIPASARGVFNLGTLKLE